MKNSALLMIDVQQSFFHSPYWQSEYFPAFKHRLRNLLDAAKLHGIPLVRILHSEPGSNTSFDPEFEHVVPMESFGDVAELTITKHVHNAFTGTQLEEWLHQHNVDHLYICGIRTEQCCETTTRVASDMGFDVDFVLDATLTFDMSVAGISLSAQELYQRTQVVLEDRFARVTTVDQCCKEWES